MKKIICIIISFILLNNKLFAQSDNLRIKCSRTSVCGVGLCCRGIDNKIIPAALYQFNEVDWWRAQIGLNPGNCTTELAKEGEFCDSFCLCSQGLLCTPNILCRSCGNICMTSEFVNKLVSYYDLGCNCIGNTAGIAGLNAGSKPTLTPGLASSLTQGLNPILAGLNPIYNQLYNYQSLNAINGYPIYNGIVHSGFVNSTKNSTKIRLVNNVVQLPGSR